MDALLASLGNLLAAFTQPIDIVLLFIIFGESYALWFYVLKPLPERIKADLERAEAFKTLAELIRGMVAKLPSAKNE